MSYEQLPPDVELGVKQFATKWQISHDEAVVKLIETGLQHVVAHGSTAPPAGKETNPGETLIGLMSSPEDAAMMDEITTEAMQARRQRWERLSRA